MRNSKSTNKILYIVITCLAFSFVSPVFSESENKLTAPEFYIDKDACPFECCTYGNWTVKAGTPGYEKTNLNSKITGYFQEGNIVYAGKGEAHVYPGKFVVKEITQKNRRLSSAFVNGERKLSNEVKVGDVFYLYTYMGEGYYKIWYKGDFYEDSIVASGIEGEIIKKPESTWWVYAESPLGWAGWTKEPYRFGNNSGCQDAYLWNVRVIYKSKQEKIRSKDEMINYYKLIKQLDSIDGAKILGNGYAVAHDKLNSMYIDLHVIDIHTMNVEKRINEVKNLSEYVYRVSSELGIKDRVSIEAMCNYCGEINLQY